MVVRRDDEPFVKEWPEMAVCFVELRGGAVTGYVFVDVAFVTHATLPGMKPPFLTANRGTGRVGGDCPTGSEGLAVIPDPFSAYLHEKDSTKGLWRKRYSAT